MVQINDQPEYKDSHRQNHLQQSTLKSATIQKHHLLLQACSLISNLHLKKKHSFKPEYNSGLYSSLY